MRVALVGAFPFPVPQGSQVFVEGQRAALARAGAEPVLVTYRETAFSGAWTRSRSGPSPGKPLADAALLHALLREHARSPIDVVLAHNAEAAVVSIAARVRTGVPVVYVAHTVLAHELSAYAPPRWRGLLDRAGGAVDRFIAARADGIIALSEDARGLLAPAARCRIEVIPPGLEPKPPPPPEEGHRLCREIGVEPQRFVLYAGNLDGYQELELLDAAAALCRDEDIPFVAATHDARDGAERYPNLKIVLQSDFGRARALQFAAGALVLTRRRPGGFPIKLLNYMETGRPLVAFSHIAPGLVDGVSARLLDEPAGPGELAEAVRELLDQPERAEALGRAAREHLLARHGWPGLADRTLAFAARSLRSPPGRSG